MPFIKGQSGNPIGRSKVNEAHREKCRRLEREAIDTLRDALKATKLNGEAMVESADWKARIEAAKVLLDRGFGKPAQEVTGTIEVNGAEPNDLHAEIASILAGATRDVDAGTTGEPH